jgi:hypothetical protein
VLAVICLLLAVYFAYQFLASGDSSVLQNIPASEWQDLPAIPSWLKVHAILLTRWMRDAVHGTLPNGHFGMILKMAVAAVAAAVFLRGPVRN